MAAWKFVLGPAAGGHETELTSARDRKATFRLISAHEFGFTVDGRDAQAALIRELTTDLHVLRDGVILGRGRIGPTSDAVGPLTHSVNVGALDYREVLRRRLLYADAPLTHGQKDQSQIAWDLVNYTQGLPAGDLGISRGAGRTGRFRDRTYEAGQFVGVLVDNLGAVIDGFDWDVTPISASALSFDVFYPKRGENKGVILDYGGSVTSLSRSVDVREFANAGRYSGGEGTTPVALAAEQLIGKPEGRWDTQSGDPDIKQQATLAEHAEAEIAESATIVPAYTVKLKPGFWQGKDHLWLGDTCRVVVMSGRLKVDTTLPVDSTGSEDITVTLGAPRPDYRRRTVEQLRTLNKLERR